MNKDYVKWFLKGFALITILLLIVVVIYGVQDGVAKNTSNDAGSDKPQNDFLPDQVTGGAIILDVPAADFHPVLDPTLMRYSITTGMWSGNNTESCLAAPVNFQNQVTVTAVYAALIDEDNANQAWFRLYRHSNTSGEFSEIMAEISTGLAYDDGLTFLGDSSIDYAVVASPDYSYYLGGCLESSSVRMVDFQINYTR